ncbi:hypothetical protein ACOSP7_005391 [Xanthoceras sorbifolium]
MLSCNSLCLFQYVPIFADKYMSSRNAKFIKLQVPDGREWPVQISWSRSAGPDSTKGWQHSHFRENNLKEGDLCEFELIRKKDNLLKVSVSLL